MASKGRLGREISAMGKTAKKEYTTINRGNEDNEPNDVIHHEPLRTAAIS